MKLSDFTKARELMSDIEEDQRNLDKILEIRKAYPMKQDIDAFDIRIGNYDLYLTHDLAGPLIDIIEKLTFENLEKMKTKLEEL